MESVKLNGYEVVQSWVYPDMIDTVPLYAVYDEGIKLLIITPDIAKVWEFCYKKEGD